MTVFFSILYTIIILLLLVFIHEFGHFIVAKACNTKVDELSLGMGPLIWQREKGETLYSLRALPLGGYCAFDGEMEKDETETIETVDGTEEVVSVKAPKPERDRTRDLANKAWWQKLLILAAGPFMNLVLCVLILTSIILIGGTIDNTLGEVEAGYPAAVAGLETGDKITSIDGHEIIYWADVTDAITGSESESLSVEYIDADDNETYMVDVVPVLSEDGSRMIIGVKPLVQHRPLYSLKAGVISTGQMAKMMYDVLFGFFNGTTTKDAISGPVGMVNAVEQSVSMGFVYVAYIAAIISLNLAIINLLPFPSLDGGRILFVFIRLVTGKAVTDEIENKFHFVGIMLLLLLMVVITFNDISRLVH